MVYEIIKGKKEERGKKKKTFLLSTMKRAEVRRPTLGLKYCPHKGQDDNIECCRSLGRNPYAHLESPMHRACAADCEGCKILQQANDAVSVLPDSFPFWEGHVAQPHKPIEYESLFAEDRQPYDTLHDKNSQDAYHDLFKVMGGIVYRTSNLQDAFHDFYSHCKLASTFAADKDDTEKTTLELLGLLKSVKLSDAKAKLTLRFFQPSTPWTHIKEAEENLLQKRPLQALPSSIPHRATYSLPLLPVLESLLLKRKKQLEEGGSQQLEIPEITLKFTVDAGRIFSGRKSSDAYLTIGSFEDADRGKQEVKSRKTTYMIFVQPGRFFFLTLVMERF